MAIDRDCGEAYICPMLLAIDIGNTNTVVGIFDNSRLIAHFRVTSNREMTVDEAGMFVSSLFYHHTSADIKLITGVAVCSVVPRLTEVYSRMTAKYFTVNPVVISSDIKLPFEIKYPYPREIGADRLANVAAANKRFGKAAIVVDMGTATTFDVIDTQGAYLGGVIAPGAHTAMANLSRKAARLFDVEPVKPDQAIGKTTAGALQSGLYYGTIGMIDNILRHIIAEMDTNPLIVTTGGDAELFAAGSELISENIPTLTLEGIALLADLNIED